MTLTPSNIGAVPTSRTVAGHALTADVVVAYTDITGTPDLTTKADLVGGVVPTSQIPVIALNTSVTVADQAAMLALTSSQVQPGDLAIRGDGAGTFMLMATDPSVLSNWKLLDAPADAVSSVNGQTGVVVLGASDVNALAITDTRVAPPPTVADAGKVVTVKADGSGYGLDAGGGALTTASATLATTATPATSSNFTYQTIPALAAGTWLVTVTAAVKPATAGLVLIRTSVTGTATIVGQSTIQDTNAATNGYTSLVATWLLGADGGSTVDLQASLNGGGSILGSAAYTGWIAVKIA